ncbi:uncharacterized protein EDB91DRAFT_164227 [Suillus paluster]|uniref:uncharacterized protein n=1 Tax=Suillus paluster TaxID=48578 RepID=UPI001B85DA16|nr:uncharacterized protein EDB91DRAFT_164227 [Suillus paluster]KAG1723469.1 hypothetical protein EDB91DRAFT_164227 [Suillus paluster]
MPEWSRLELNLNLLLCFHVACIVTRLHSPDATCESLYLAGRRPALRPTLQRIEVSNSRNQHLQPPTPRRPYIQNTNPPSTTCAKYLELPALPVLGS